MESSALVAANRSLASEQRLHAQGAGPLVGAEPVAHVSMMEDHDKAYHVWKQAGFKERTVVHVDAHVDFGWIPEKDPADLRDPSSLRELEERAAQPGLWNVSARSPRELVHLGNYLHPALRENILKSFYWVVPDGFLATRKQRLGIEKMLRVMNSQRSHVFNNITWVDGVLRAEVYGKLMVVCTLSDLPVFDESVLLDIDTDFLVVDSLSPSYPFADPLHVRPWIWPGELVAQLKERSLRSDCVTIAYSVEGGYTPLGYKYLGDELAMLLRNPSLDAERSRAMRLKKQAAQYHAEGKLSAARRACEAVLAADPEDASSYYRLAQVSYDLGQDKRAQRLYERAVALDPSYGTAYNNRGRVHFSLGRLPETEAEYRKALTFDPGSAEAHCGLADVHVTQGRWRTAMFHYQRARELMPDHARSRLGLGYLYLKLRKWSAAESELRQALHSKGDQALAQYWLGRIYIKQKRWNDGLAAYRAAKRGGVHHVDLYVRLGTLYLRKNNFYEGRRHYAQAARLVPALLLFWLHRIGARMKKVVFWSRSDV